jgi:Fe-S cluster biogenesis protein NfuA
LASKILESKILESTVPESAILESTVPKSAILESTVLESRVLESIERILDEKVRPVLREHGGDVRVASFADGVLKVKMQGACNNCPSAVFDVEQLVASEIREAISEVREVTLAVGVSDELLEMARELMKNR